nr:uncharacterized protein LOC109154171 [Ipomoea trifida]
MNTPCIDNLIHAKVSGLFNEAGTWDEDVVRDLFVPSNVRRIFATPVSPNAQDIWRWKGDIRGLYTVRHGYRLLTSSSIHADPQLQFLEWRKLWKLPVPPKVKNFLWRCMRNILPVREVLKIRHVWAGGGCPFCSFDMESMDHLFCSCPEVAQVWHGSNIMLTGSLVLLINNMLCSSSVKETMHVAAKLWLIWKARNYVIWKGKTFCAVDLLRQALWLHDSWFSAYSRNTDSLVDNSGSTSWTPPPTNIFKCNVDAAVFEDGAGFGVVVRDQTGKFISAYSARLGCNCDCDWIRNLHHPHRDLRLRLRSGGFGGNNRRLSFTTTDFFAVILTAKIRDNVTKLQPAPVWRQSTTNATIMALKEEI